MREERGGFLPPVVQSVNIGNWYFGKFFFRDALEAANIDAVHLSDRCLVSDTEGTDATVLTEEVLVLPRIEEILGHIVLARQQSETVGLGNRYPEPVSPADGAVAPVGARRQVEISFEPYCSAVATPLVCFQHSLRPCLNSIVLCRLNASLKRLSQQLSQAKIYGTFVPPSWRLTVDE
jgi:hypothetical protein